MLLSLYFDIFEIELYQLIIISLRKALLSIRAWKELIPIKVINNR